eukprot:85038_1
MGVDLSLASCDPSRSTTLCKKNKQPFCGMTNGKSDSKRERIVRHKVQKANRPIKPHKVHRLRDEGSRHGHKTHESKTHKFNANLKHKSKNIATSKDQEEEPSHPIEPNETSHQDGALNIPFRNKMSYSHSRDNTVTKLPLPPPRRDKKRYVIRITSNSLNEYDLTKQGGFPFDLRDLYKYDAGDEPDEETDDDESCITPGTPTIVVHAD